MLKKATDNQLDEWGLQHPLGTEEVYNLLLIEDTPLVISCVLPWLPLEL